MRKWIRETRDFWWGFCEKRNANPDLVKLNKKLDAIKTQVESNYQSHSKALEDAKEAFIEYYGRSERNIKGLTDFSGLSDVTGISLPVSLLECPQCHGPLSLLREEKREGGNTVRWYRCDRCSRDLPPIHGYQLVTGLRTRRGSPQL
jgi:hypothetical protein